MPTAVMTGDEHYQEAHRIIGAAKSEDEANRQGFTGWPQDTLIALAQVHATLAQADYTRCALYRP